MKKIGIITWHYYPNFGSALQAFALYRTISNLGYNAEIINYHNPKYTEHSIVRKIAKVVLGNLPILKYKYGHSQAFSQFLGKLTILSRFTESREGLKEVGDNYSCIVAGSDQIWAPNVFNPIYMIDFADGNKVNKISYAASVGLNDIPEDLAKQYTELLNDFSAVSTRESEGAELLKKKCGIAAQVVLDPTLLVNSHDYRIIESRDFLPEDPTDYVFCYFLNANHEYRERVENYAKSIGKRVVGWSAKSSDAEWMDFFPSIGPREFLYLIDHAYCMITDSYHGTIFSMLLHTPFWTFQRFAPTDPICQNSRIRQLNDYFDINDRIIVSQTIPTDAKPYDFSHFESRLTEERNNSLNFLKTNLK